MPAYYTDQAQFVSAIQDSPKRKRGLAMGDSWFQYPLRKYGDLQRKIAIHYKGKIEFFDDSYPGRDAREMDHVLHRVVPFAEYLDSEIKKPFDLILLSMGGNDVIGKDFQTHLKKATDPGDSKVWRWNATIPEVVDRHILLGRLTATFQTIEDRYRKVLAMRDAHARQAWVFTHTYADVTPTNKSYQFVGIKLAGPWLWKPMRQAGLTGKAEQKELARWLLESFANLLLSIQADPAVERFQVLDSRLELTAYDGWWDNEIHPLGNGFKFLTETYWIPAIDQALGL
jgi:hypothetical protein